MGPLIVVGALAVLAAVLLGFWLGKAAGRTEGAVLREQVCALEKEKNTQATQAREFQQSIADLSGKLGSAQAEVAAERNRYAQMQAGLESAFGDLAAKALRSNNQSFLTLAKEALGGQNAAAKQAFEAKELAIKNLLDPLSAALTRLDEQARGMETQRSSAYAKVETLVENMQKAIPASLDALKNETAQLITALRAPKTRGNWGELQLKRCVEYAGMVQYCSFAEQISARDVDNNLLRPDMTIQLPNGRLIIVDAKTPLDAFLDSSENGEAAVQALRFATHAARVKSHLRDLSSKAYWKQFDHTPEFVVCFLPSEALFSAALEADPSLIEFGTQANVVMATPTTLIALLKAVAYGWQQSQVAQNAKAIQEAGRDLYSKLVNAHEYFERMGAALGNAVGHYNRFIGAVEGRGGAFFHARKLGSLVHDNNELDFLKPAPVEPRLLTDEDWPSSSGLEFAAEAAQNGESE
jgi:DNA recombination protein RmuC